MVFSIDCVKCDFLTVAYLQEGVVKYKRESGWLLVVLRRGDSDSWETNQTGERTRWDGWKILPQAWGKREPTNPHIHNVISYDLGSNLEVQQKMTPKFMFWYIGFDFDYS